VGGKVESKNEREARGSGSPNGGRVGVCACVYKEKGEQGNSRNPEGEIG